MTETTNQKPPDKPVAVLQSKPMCVQCMGTGYIDEGKAYYKCTYCHGAGAVGYAYNYDSDSYARRTLTPRYGSFT